MKIVAVKKKAVVFEHRLLEKYQPRHEKFMDAFHKGMQKTNTSQLVEIVGPKKSLGAARALGWLDLGLEAVNFASMAGALFYLAGGFGKGLEQTVSSILASVARIFTDLPAGRISREFLVFAFCATVSKASVKAGTYVELAQMLVVDSVSRQFREPGNGIVKKHFQRYAKESLKEQAKDTLLFWVPLPFLETVRRIAAVRSELRQLRSIRKLEECLAPANKVSRQD